MILYVGIPATAPLQLRHRSVLVIGVHAAGGRLTVESRKGLVYVSLSPQFLCGADMRALDSFGSHTHYPKQGGTSVGTRAWRKSTCGL